MLTNQNKTLFVILANQNKVFCIKIKQSSEKLETADKLNIFSNIQLLNKNFGSNIDGNMKE